MPQWAGSCWYEIRYTDPTNSERFVDREVERYWMGPRDGGDGSTGDPGGVDLYVGGVEHAVLHLLYARFWHKVLYDLGEVSSAEPFRRLFNQGYVQAYAYRDARGFVVPAAEVSRRRQGRLHLAGPAGAARGREDGQEPEERRHPGRDLRAVRRRHVPAVRDEHRAAGRGPAVGDPRRRRLPAVPAADVATGGRREDRRAAGRRRSRPWPRSATARPTARWTPRR